MERYSELPPHLGGHLNRTHTDRGTLWFLLSEYKATSFLDIGCGPGEMVELASLRGCEATGIDGDFTIQYSPTLSKKIIIHDFTKGPAPLDREYDLGWSVEFLEHVEEQYQENYMDAFARCRYVVATAAPPGYPGHHHVNCRELNYWIAVFDRHGFNYSPHITERIRSQESTMQKPFMQSNGMFFVRRGA